MTCDLFSTPHPSSSTQITINRPERRNAFRPETVSELQRAFTAARDDPSVGAIIFTGKARPQPLNPIQSNPIQSDPSLSAVHLHELQSHIIVFADTISSVVFQGDKAFCSGGDQAVRGKGGYVGGDTIPRLNVLDLQVQFH